MKKTFKNVSFVILLLQLCIVFGQEISTRKIIVIDPGHGGKDSGTISENQIREKDVVMAVANAILMINNTVGSPMDIYLTRYSDTLITLSDRVKLAKVLKADLFLSLHCNHSDNPNARGIEVYISNTNSKFSNQATWVAFKLQSLLNKKLGFKSRG